MDGETFAETLKKKFEEYPSFKTCEQTYEVNYINPLIETIVTYGDFLNDIPIIEREKFIEESFLVWVHNYYCLNQHIWHRNKTCDNYYPKADPSKKIRQIIKTLQDFQNLINEQFGEFFEEMQEYGEDYSLNRNYLEKLKQIAAAAETSRKLQDDIQNKHFKYFQKQRFYKQKLTSKEELKRILEDAKKTYNLNVNTFSIKDLISNIQNFIYSDFPKTGY